MSEISITVRQTSPTASQATIRTHTVMIDRPLEKDGTDEGAMGGELLLVALGGCFMSTLLAAIRAREASINNISINVVGNLESNPSRFSAIQLQISADYTDPEMMQKLLVISEKACIVANTIGTAVELSFVLV